MKVFSIYGQRPKQVLRHNDGTLLVEKAGYQPAYKEIANMIASGERFQRARAFQYANEVEIDKQVKHVDLSDKDNFEVMDMQRSISAEMIADREARALETAAKAKEAEKEVIIKEYEAVKAAAAAKAETSPQGA